MPPTVDIAGSTSGLLNSLRDVRRRVKVLGVAYGVGVVLAVAVGLLLAAVFVDWLLVLSLPLRLLVNLAALGALGYALVRWVARPVLLKLSLTDLAGRLENVFPQFDDTLRSTVNFAVHDVPGSDAMKARTVAKAAETAKSVDLYRAIELKPVGLSVAAGVGAVALLVGIAAAADPNLRRIATNRLFGGAAAWPKAVEMDVAGGLPERVAAGQSLDVRMRIKKGTAKRAIIYYRYDDGRWEQEVMERGADGTYAASLAARLEGGKETGRLQIRLEAGDDEQALSPVTVVPRLDIKGVLAFVTPPAYARLPASPVQISERPVVTALGSDVELQVTFNKPLNTAKPVRIESADKARHAPEVAWAFPAPGEAVGRLTLADAFKPNDPFRFTLRATDADGFENTGSQEYQIIVHDDALPTVQIEKPQRNEERTPTATVPLKVVAEDDYGIDAAELVVKGVSASLASKTWTLPLLTGTAVAPDVTWAPADSTTERKRFRLEYQWDLEKLDGVALKPGDQFEFMVRVKDNFDYAGRQHPFVESGKLRVTIISPEQWERAVETALANERQVIAGIKKAQDANHAETASQRQELAARKAFDDAVRATVGRLANQQSTATAQAKQSSDRLRELVQRMAENKSPEQGAKESARQVAEQLDRTAEGVMKQASQDLSRARDVKADPNNAGPTPSSPQAVAVRPDAKDDAGNQGPQTAADPKPREDGAAEKNPAGRDKNDKNADGKGTDQQNGQPSKDGQDKAGDTAAQKPGADDKAGDPKAGNDKQAGNEKAAGENKPGGDEKSAGSDKQGDGKQSGDDKAAGADKQGDGKQGGDEKSANGDPKAGGEKAAGADKAADGKQSDSDKQSGGNPKAGADQKAGGQPKGADAKAGDPKSAAAQKSGQQGGDPKAGADAQKNGSPQKSGGQQKSQQAGAQNQKGGGQQQPSGGQQKPQGQQANSQQQNGQPKPGNQQQQPQPQGQQNDAEKVALAMDTSAQNQQEASKQLDQAMNKLNDFGGLQPAIQKVQDLKNRQEQLAKDYKEAMKNALGKKADDLSAAEKQKLKDLVEKQDELAKQTEKAIADMENKSEKMNKSDPAGSKAMKDAAQAGKQRGIPQKQSNPKDSNGAAQDMEQNQQANAQQKHKEIDLGLELILDKLKEAEKRKLEQLNAELANLQKLIEQLIARQATHNIDNLVLQDPKKIAALPDDDRTDLFDLAGRDPKKAADLKPELSVLTPSQEQTERNARDFAKRAEDLPDPTPGTKLTAAAAKMEQAIVNLRRAKLPEAYDPAQVAALAALRDAHAAVTEMKQKAEEEMAQKNEETIKQAFARLLEQQKKLNDETKGIDATPKDKDGNLPFLLSRRLGQLPGDQGKLAESAQEQGKKLEGLKSIVYVWANKDIVSSMNEVKADLAKPDTGASTQAEQKRIADQLQAMVDNLAKKQDKQPKWDQHKAGQQQPQKGGQGGQQKPPPKMPTDIEMRLLKDLQVAINKNTNVVDAEVQKNGGKKDAQQLLSLGNRQGDLRGLLDRLLQESSEGEAKLGKEPDNKDQLPEEASKDAVEDQEFLKGLLEDNLQAETVEKGIKITGDRMARSRQRLALNNDPGKTTQEIQKRIVEGMDDMIKLSQKQQQQMQQQASKQRQKGQQPKPGEQQPGQQPGGPQEANGQQNGQRQENGKNSAAESVLTEGGDPRLDISRELKEKLEEWGAITPRARQAVLEGRSEKPVEKYRKLIEDYNKGIAKQQSAKQ